MLKIYFFSTGTIIANESVQLVPETSGKIMKLNLPEGKNIQKGELLLKINDSELQAQLRKLKTEEFLAIEKESRQKKLFEINSVSKDEYESALNNLQLIRSDQEIIKTQIAKTELRAPFNGRLGFKNVSEGSYVSTAVVVANLHQLDPVKIDFSIPERYAKLVQLGRSIFFKSDVSDKMTEAKIIAIEPVINESTRSLKIRAQCPNKQNMLLAGSFVRIEINLLDQEKSILIPTEALIPILKAYKVFVYKSGKAAEVKVITGLRTETQVQITEGLQEGDTLITSGIMQLKAGSPVKIVSITDHE
ncbi:MAG: efflux RND transporter periplasmic adaptor subunit [Saprospiraceae bacterium]|nr:efflux RND transporter periplasmic adaptor subunit [Saprospiraceae bacterium]